MYLDISVLFLCKKIFCFRFQAKNNNIHDELHGVLESEKKKKTLKICGWSRPMRIGLDMCGQINPFIE